VLRERRLCLYLGEAVSSAEHHVLILSAGRRVELLKAFKLELNTRGLQSLVLATDSNPQLSAACQVADKAFAMPRVTAEGYLDELLALCIKESVGLVIPTIDTELLGLAQARERFLQEGIHLVISEEALIRACRDKRVTANLFESLNIETPGIFSPDQLVFPCFAKPYDGSRSIGAFKLGQATDLTSGMRSDPKLIFMEYIDSSFEEYTVDAYFDRVSSLKSLVPRHRLEVRDGETSKGVTRKNHVYHYLKERLSGLRGARGCVTVQLFAHPAGSQYAAIEINPRFGGGYPLSYAAGANYPGWLIDEYLLNKEVPFFDGWESNLLMLRYDSQVLVRDAV
jgi:carbamoyl-phosphate synthase large subunit